MRTTSKLFFVLAVIIALPAQAELIPGGDPTLCFREGLKSGRESWKAGELIELVTQEGWCKEVSHHTLDYSNQELRELLEVWEEELWQTNSSQNKRLYLYTLEIVNDTSGDIVVASANADMLTSPYYAMTRALQHNIPPCTKLRAVFISPWEPKDVVDPDFYVGYWMDVPDSPQETLRRMWVVGSPLSGDMPVPISPLYYYSEGLTFENILPEKAASVACKK